MLKQPDTNVWLVQLSLLPGPVTFKFVTDDEWVTTSSYDVVEDGFGGENNHRTISVSPENKHLQGEGEINPASDQTSEGGQEELEHEFEDEKPKKEEDAVCTIC